MLKQIVWGIVLSTSLLIGAARADDALNEQLNAVAEAGDKAKVESLLAAGADANFKDTSLGFTPLGLAVGYGYKDVVDVLLSHGADINVIVFQDYTPLDYAIVRGYKDVVVVILAHGADPNAKNNDGLTPLMMAVEKGDKDMAEVLLAHGANINTKDNQGDTILMLARHAPDTKQQAMLAFLQERMSEQEHTDLLSDPRQLDNLLVQFKGRSDNDVLRASIIKLALKKRPAPPFPLKQKTPPDGGPIFLKMPNPWTIRSAPPRNICRRSS